MKIAQLASHFARVVAAYAVAVFAMLASPVLAATIEIGFTGMNLVYDGSVIYDAGSIAGGLGNPADADPLNTVDFTVDGNLVGSLSSDISLDVFIPDVTSISAAANAVEVQTTTGNPGFFDILFGTTPLASEFLLVDLDEVSVTYLDVQNIVQFTFGAAISNTFAQNLPFGLVIGAPITVSFNAQIVPGTKTDNGLEITGFAASGAGVVRGANVPEPTACLMAAMGVLAVAAIRGRR